VALHHHDSNVPASDRLLLRIQVADAIASRLCSPREAEHPANLARSYPVILLGLDNDDLTVVMAEVEEQFARARDLFE
jgi:hypothetical protein